MDFYVLEVNGHADRTGGDSGPCTAGFRSGLCPLWVILARSIPSSLS
jgi:hypothetical protein